jgi:hypothetical protein
MQPPSRPLVGGPTPLAPTSRPPSNLLVNRGATAVVTNVDAQWANMLGDLDTSLESQLAEMDSTPAVKKKRNWLRRKIDALTTVPSVSATWRPYGSRNHEPEFSGPVTREVEITNRRSRNSTIESAINATCVQTILFAIDAVCGLTHVQRNV